MSSSSSSISIIIGTGNMASALAGRALAGGNAVEIIGRDPVKAKELAAALGGATVGTAGTAPAGDIVVLAVPYASAAAVIGEYGDALDGKVIVDMTNPITLDFKGFVTPGSACWIWVGGVAEGHEENQLRRISVSA